MRTSTGRQILTTLFYLVVAAALAGCLVPFVNDVLPKALASRVSHNSEAYVIVLILVPWIQYVRPRLVRRPAQWPVTALVAVACLAVGIALIESDLPSRFRTLNEAFIALAVLVPYAQLRRPLSLAAPVGLAALALLVAVVFHGNSEVVDLAEVVGALVLVPLGLDVVDRGILDPAARTSTTLRWGWYAFLVVVPIVCAVLEYHVGVHGVFGQVIRYEVRCNEDWIAALLVSLELAVVLGRTGRRQVPAERGVATRQVASAH